MYVYVYLYTFIYKVLTVKFNILKTVTFGSYVIAYDAFD